MGGLSCKNIRTTDTFSCSFAWPESASVSFSVLVDIGVVAVDLDSILRVLAVVPIAVVAVHMLVAAARGFPLVKTLRAPVLIRVAGTVLVVSIATSRMVGKGGLIVGLRGVSLPLVKTLGAPVGVRVAGTVLVVSISTSWVVGKGGLIVGISDHCRFNKRFSNNNVGVNIFSLPLVVMTVVTLVICLPLVKTLGAPVGIRVARTVLIVSISTSWVVGKGRLVVGLRGLGLPLVVVVPWCCAVGTSKTSG